MAKVVRLSIIEGPARELEALFTDWQEGKRREHIDEALRVVSVSAPMPTPLGYAVSVLWETAARAHQHGRRHS